MRANRTIGPRDDAVSPVIAVILMVAITVVLAATVYIWVTGFSTEGDQAPPIGLRTEEQRSASWKVRVASMSQGARTLDSFRFSLTTPTNGTFVANATTFSTFGANATTTGANSVTIMATGYTAQGANFCCWSWQLQFIDADANAVYSSGDRMIVTYDDNDDGGSFDDSFPSGIYKFEVLHIESGEISGSVTTTFA